MGDPTQSLNSWDSSLQTNPKSNTHVIAQHTSVTMVKDNETVIEEFNELVNMSSSELEAWLKEEQSTSSGWSKDDGSGETIGHDSGRRIVEILNPLALSSTPANVRQRGKKKIKGAAAEVWEERERVLGVGDGSARVCVDDPSSGGKVRRPVASFAGFLRRSTPRPTLARNARTPSRGHERARPK